MTRRARSERRRACAARRAGGEGPGAFGEGEHVTQLLKKETEAETPERQSEGEGLEAKLHTLCRSPRRTAELGAVTSRSGSWDWGRRSQGGLRGVALSPPPPQTGRERRLLTTPPHAPC